jgi:hypothetical protein
MKRSLIYLLPLVIILVILSCKGSKQTEQLYGKWKYIKVEHPNTSDTVSRMELEENIPFIELTKGNKLQINWGGKVLSHGTFKFDGSNIYYTESLPGGKTRQFPFYVSELTGTKIVFETTGEEGSRVTAVKQQ